MSKTMTPEDFLKGTTKITFITGNIPAAKGTPEYFSELAEKTGTVEAHNIAIEAWRKHEVYSFGGACLRQARIQTHQAAISKIQSR